jgi:hypothetical protein
MNEEQLQQARNGLHLACSGLAAAANACRCGSHPYAVLVAQDLDGLHQRTVTIAEDIRWLPEVQQRTKEDGSVTLFIEPGGAVRLEQKVAL